MQRILVVEDDFDIQELLQNFLQEAGYEVAVANDGVEALSLFSGQRYDLIILDILLPKIDGYGVCELIRKQSDVPIIMLTALSGEEDQIRGLDLQVDDYITKPFNILEVKARIKAILRRNSKASAKTEASSRIETGDMRMDCDSRSLFIHDKEVYLTAKEFDLLELLVLNPNKVYSRETLLNTIWGYDYPGDARTVDVHVRRLREKIEENPSEPKYVHTKWGVGYYFNV